MEKENILSIREDKKFSLGNFDSKRASVIDPPPPPTNCISLLFMIRAVNSNIQLASNKSTSEREREREKIPQSVGKVSRIRPLSAVEGS